MTTLPRVLAPPMTRGRMATAPENFSLVEQQAQSTAGTATVQAEAGKAVAVMLYNIGARSVRETQAAFDHHREWSAA